MLVEKRVVVVLNFVRFCIIDIFDTRWPTCCWSTTKQDQAASALRCWYRRSYLADLVARYIILRSFITIPARSTIGLSHANVNFGFFLYDVQLQLICQHTVSLLLWRHNLLKSALPLEIQTLILVGVFRAIQILLLLIILVKVIILAIWIIFISWIRRCVILRLNRLLVVFWNLVETNCEARGCSIALDLIILVGIIDLKTSVVIIWLLVLILIIVRHIHLFISF